MCPKLGPGGPLPELAAGCVGRMWSVVGEIIGAGQAGRHELFQGIAARLSGFTKRTTCEVVPDVVELEVAVPRLMPAVS